MFTDTRQTNFSLFLSDLVCAGGSAAISKTIVAPLERIKVLLQAQRTMIIPEGYRYKGLLDALQRIPSEQGALAFWRGNGANLYRIIPSTIIRFTSYDTYKRMSMPRGEFGYSGAERFLLKVNAGFLSGLTTLVFTYPFDLAKTRLSLDFSRVGTPKTYLGVMDCLRKTKRAENLRSIYKGFFLSLGITLPYSMISIVTYDLLRENLIFQKSGDNQVNAAVRFIGIGTLAGLSAQLITYPLDTVRRRIQVNGALGQESLYKGTWDCMKKMASTEGVGAFYAGIIPNLLKFVPAAAIQFAAYDLLKKNVVEAGLI